MSPTTSDGAGSVATDEAPDTELRESQPAAAGRVVGGVAWLGRFLLALFLFVGALQVMKTGAGKLEALQHGGFLVQNAASTLGLGWLGALLVLSGSPIAASALSLVSAGSINPTEGFTMLTGSRLGAAFVVLLVAVMYALRGGEGRRMAPVSTAVMALTATAVIYMPAALLGYGLLRWSPFQALNLQFPGQFSDLLDLVYGDLLAAVEGWPAAVLFLGGLGILLVAFKLIDTVVPEIGREEIERSRLSWMASKWPMFALGCLVALIAMSVSVALTVLVPLVAKGYVKREDILPYIMGANITTLGDTLLAAFLLDSSAAVQIVLAGIVGTTLVSVVVLAFFYPQLKRGIWRFQRQIVKSKPRLFAFTAGLFLVPLALIGIAGVAS
jgi:solute carrier family 34 (sodium-dependent phosphate cotransporter)